ncbi:hypothetical protein [Desulforhabdus sp. TSK]|uniref:hypothetical protein n=1 Tax=Desulforhabdus sp. TSK TaxID=2925014 RepID=UPI001FC8E2A5|nr:hypothetical protein [Desulforhabdus sp. TSK]GKT07123.1 hypothetical protein DSTSK_04280 [Desulforhabdus sp. TSK]
MESTLHIGQLNLRVPGKSADTGHKVADGVAEKLVQKVPPGMRCQVGALSVRVQVAASASEVEMSDAISEAIVKAIHSGSEAASGRQR